MADEHRAAGLLDDAALEASVVVANCAMNRERQLAGANSYTRELGFNPLNVITSRLSGTGSPAGVAAWLDLCCGTGRALIQAACQLHQARLAGRATLVGVDLAGAFDSAPAAAAGLELVCAPVATWTPGRAFDLITCVHGLHYVGDKLGLLTRAACWLAPTGRLVADLDLHAIRIPGTKPGSRGLATQLRAAGFSYDPRRHRISCTGHRDIRLPYLYLGADDRAGANYTGQPAVHSYYAQTQ